MNYGIVSLLELIRSMIPISEGQNLMRCMARKHILHFKNKTGDKLQSNYLIGLINCRVHTSSHLPVCVRAVRKPIHCNNNKKKNFFSQEAAHNINMK